jgi:hypothetical protein
MQADLIPLESIVIDPDGFRWIVGAVTFTGWRALLHAPQPRQ